MCVCGGGGDGGEITRFGYANDMQMRDGGTKDPAVIIKGNEAELVCILEQANQFAYTDLIACFQLGHQY